MLNGLYAIIFYFCHVGAHWDIALQVEIQLIARAYSSIPPWMSHQLPSRRYKHHERTRERERELRSVHLMPVRAVLACVHLASSFTIATSSYTGLTAISCARNKSVFPTSNRRIRISARQSSEHHGPASQSASSVPFDFEVTSSRKECVRHALACKQKQRLSEHERTSMRNAT